MTGMLRLLNRLPTDTVYDRIKSPVGTLWLLASSQGLHAILWDKDLEMVEYQNFFLKLKLAQKHPVILQTKIQLKEYFAGKRTSFDIPLVLDGTDFQKKAWKQLTKIPYGKTISYQNQAKKIGDLKKARAVGTANARNPISIVVPCHRVIAKNGELSGFGGGIHNKQFLLNLENRNL